MPDFNLGLAGAVTVTALVVLGILVYPWLLRKRGGWAAVAVVIAALLVRRFRLDEKSS
jgi:O-antigen ligase